MSPLRQIDAAHTSRGWHLAVIIVRLLLGFAFLPAGLKKVLGQPFTNAANHGRFHDFLHSFLATDGFYRAVGVLQLTIAGLYLWQSSLLAPLLALPVLTAILLFTWATWVPVTASVVSLMWLATVGLLVWALPRWLPLVKPGLMSREIPSVVELAPWRLCGAAVLVVYAGLCVATGSVYRPGPSPGGAKDTAFWIMSSLPLLPFATWLWQRQHQQRR